MEIFLVFGVLLTNPNKKICIKIDGKLKKKKKKGEILTRLSLSFQVVYFDCFWV